MPDIDIDFADRTEILNIIKHVPASILDKDKSKKHNTGVYVQDIPSNPITGLSTLDYKLAEQRGYFKLDFLNVTIYKDIKDQQHLKDLMNREPLWELLEQDEFIDLLFHVKGHGDILKKMKPKSILELAAILAMIRPSKRYLIGKPWDKVFEEIWLPDAQGEYAFKKSHSVAYATLIAVQMNLICETV